MNTTSTPFIIAEAGVNHNGNRDLAFQMVDVAIEANANAIKFQTFNAKDMVIQNAPKADYQKQTTDSKESQFKMLERLELSHKDHKELTAYCKKKGIPFLSTAFDFKSLDFLSKDLGLKTLKIASGEITNGPLLLAHARTGCDLILSTGMATLGEVEEALGVIAFGLKHNENPSIAPAPSRRTFQEAYSSREGQQLLQEKVTLLQCTTAYPAPLEDINLKAMLTLRRKFGLKTGYSDHSRGITVPIAATALGATLIEKHFTLSKTLPGPDHQASLDPSELKEMVKAIREVEQIMGDGLKRPMPSELKNREMARKSLFATQKIQQGDTFTENHLAIKRPGTGRSPMDYWDIIGTQNHRPIETDEALH